MCFLLKKGPQIKTILQLIWSLFNFGIQATWVKSLTASYDVQFSFGGLVCHEHPINLDCWANKQGIKIQKTAISKCLQCGCFVLQINESEREREFPSLFRFFQGGSDVFRCFPMFPHAFQYFQMFSDAFPMPFRCPGRRGTSKQMHFAGSLLPFRCLSDAISDVCGALSDVSNVFLFSLNVRRFSCFECLTVKICKGRGAMSSDDTGAGFISEKNCGFPQIFLQSPGIHFFLLKMERPALKVNRRQNDIFFLDSFWGLHFSKQLACVPYPCELQHFRVFFLAPLRVHCARLKTCNQTNIRWYAARIGLKFSHASIPVKTWFVANFPELDYAKFSILWLFCPAKRGNRRHWLFDLQNVLSKNLTIETPQLLEPLSALMSTIFLNLTW